MYIQYMQTYVYNMHTHVYRCTYILQAFRKSRDLLWTFPAFSVIVIQGRSLPFLSPSKKGWKGPRKVSALLQSSTKDCIRFQEASAFPHPFMKVCTLHWVFPLWYMSILFTLYNHIALHFM